MNAPASTPSPAAKPTPAELHALWLAGLLHWLLWPQQLRIYNVLRSLPVHVQIIVFLLARQYGKSVMSIVIALEDCLRNPGVIVAIIAPKVEQAVSIVRPRMKLVTKSAPKGLIRELKSENTWIFPNEAELKLGGYRSGSVSQRGKTLHKVILEEFGPDTDGDGYLDFIQSDVGPALMHSKSAQILFPTTLPKIPDHPFITHTIPQAQLDGAFFIATIDDNEMLTPEKKEQAIKLAGGRGSIDCERELYCKIVRDPQLVCLPAYDDDFHVQEFSLPQYRFMHVTGDQGGTRDKTVWLLHTYDFQNDQDLIWDELVFPSNTPANEMIKVARAAWGQDLGGPQDKFPQQANGINPEVRLDAPPRQLIDMIGSDAFHATLVPKDDWQAAVNQMAVRFSERGAQARAKILIHPRCTFLRLTARSGTFNKQRNDFNRTESLGHMDALAALMYALRTQNRLSPWPAITYDRDHILKTKQEVAEMEVVARAMQGKTFGPGPKGFQHKKFGKFKG